MVKIREKIQVKINKHSVVIRASAPRTKTTRDFLNLILESAHFALKHNYDLINSDKDILIEFEERPNEPKAGFRASNKSTFTKYFIIGGFERWVEEYEFNLQNSTLRDFFMRIATTLVHELTHCHVIRELTAQEAIQRFRHDREQSFMLYLAWNTERQHDEGLAIIRQAHTLTDKGYHYQYHHDFRDSSLYLKHPNDFKDDRWVDFWKDFYGRISFNLRDAVLEFRQRSDNFHKVFHMNKHRYESSEVKGFAINYACNYRSYNYPLGTMMCYFIFIANSTDENLSIIDFDTRRRILKKSAVKKFIAGHNLAIGRIEPPRQFKRIFRKIKRMDIFDFYEEYEKACNVLGIPEELRVLSEEHKDEFFSKKRDIISWMRSA